MITRLAHVCLNVRDLQRSLAFYRDALGLPVQFTFEKGGRQTGVYLAVGERNFIEIFERADVQPVNTGIVHFCLEVDDLEAAISALTAKGVMASARKQGADHSWQSWIQDPDGNRIELHQYTEASNQRVGGTVQVTW